MTGYTRILFLVCVVIFYMGLCMTLAAQGIPGISGIASNRYSITIYSISYQVTIVIRSMRLVAVGAGKNIIPVYNAFVGLLIALVSYNYYEGEQNILALLAVCGASGLTGTKAIALLSKKGFWVSVLDLVQGELKKPTAAAGIPKKSGKARKSKKSDENQGHTE